MRNILHQLYKKLVIHWLTTLKAIAYGVLLYMYYIGKLDTQQWIMATGSILVLNSLFQKDPNKVPTKPEYQIPDPPKKDE
jgi:hypothetical protein